MLRLDEFTYGLHYGWINTSEVLEWVRLHRPPSLHLVITGHSALML